MNESHRHDPVYAAVIDLTVDGEPVGAVDVWRCRVCKQLFCEDKRWGLTELAPEIGMPRLGEGERWGILVCAYGGEVTWTLMGIKPGRNISHTCLGGTVASLQVTESFEVHGDEPVRHRATHRILLVENHLNKVVEIGRPPTSL